MIGSQIIVEPKRGLWENQFQKKCHPKIYWQTATKFNKDSGDEDP